MRYFLMIIAVVATAMCGCADKSKQSQVAAIKSVLTQDSKLGDARDHGSETARMSDTIKSYVAAVDQIEFTDCPNDFTAAFKRHRDAWENSVSFFASYDSLRGEMHDLFNIIRESGDESRAKLEQIEKQIWGTWGHVEAAMRRHGADSAGE